MTKEQLLVFTKYYKGEERCPAHIQKKENGAALWDIERGWVLETLNNSIGSDILQEYVGYVSTPNKVKDDRGLPLSLLMYLFHRIGKWDYSLQSTADGFQDFLKTYY
ncbi:MAG: hypothetical protein NC229_08505 [Bacteroides sp.]|nr:hypothetical protein [Bacteroidales bacterium]MCM1068715.1 hypothetical protein [Prevotella sp.]MCM1354685.1 hypothetical protein [Bacteroides sp.]MCM1403767.1 hypothetical protein [Bacteroides sp.]MCM1443515.1 hypothetical protein [Muribaculum sp.]